ncbi:MAG: MarR family transcriptional regulator [Hespellia sp.]|nr:MarR family transcriptional regulator [Hespellia sp.]
MTCEIETIPMQMLLRQIGHLYMQKSMDWMKEQTCSEGIRGGQAGILFMLKFKGEKGTLSQRELADFLRIKPPSVTAAVKKLEAESYVRRVRDENDQRIMRICLTEKGVLYVEHVIAEVKATEELAFKNMSTEEKLLLRRLLVQVRDNLSDGKEFHDHFMEH